MASFGPDIAVFAIVLFHNFVEQSAIRSWAPWAYHGVVVFRRHEPNALTLLKGTRIDQLVDQDSELKEIGIGVKETSPGLYLARFLPQAHRWWAAQEGFESPVTGQIRVDYDKGDIEFSARLSCGLAAGLFLGFADMILSFALARHGADLFFAVLFVPLFLVIGYFVTFRRRLVDFWFLLVTKLCERR
jgi:hypothetical protein